MNAHDGALLALWRSDDGPVCDARCEASVRDMRARYVSCPDGGGTDRQRRRASRDPGRRSRFSLDRDESSGTLARLGVQWFMRLAFFADSPNDASGLRATLERYRDTGEKLLLESQLFADVDLDEARAWEVVDERVRDRDDLPEKWAFAQALHAQWALHALAEGEVEAAAYATYVASNAHAVLMYTTHLEEIVWQGYRAERVRHLRTLLETWRTNRANGDERFWQRVLTANSLVLSQLFASPMVLHDEQAYVGGKAVDNRGGQLTDFMLRNKLTGSVTLVEIKTPLSRLVQPVEYRAGVHAPGTELTGAVAQVLSQRDKLLKTFYALVEGQDEGWRPFDPPLYVIAGDSEQLGTEAERRSFELFRNSLPSVTVVSFDELFGRLEALLELPGLDAQAEAGE